MNVYSKILNALMSRRRDTPVPAVCRRALVFVRIETRRFEMIPRQRLCVLLAFPALFSAGANAQWLNYPAPGTPLTRDGKPNLTAPTPRTADGKPDLSGVWMHQLIPLAEMKRLFGDHAGDVNVPG